MAQWLNAAVRASVASGNGSRSCGTQTHTHYTMLCSTTHTDTHSSDHRAPFGGGVNAGARNEEDSVQETITQGACATVCNLQL